MSTKIYNGYRLRTGTIADLNALLRGFQAAALAASRDRMAALCARYAVRCFDKQTIGMMDADKSPASEAFWHVMERQDNVRKTDRRDPEVDLECMLSLFPHGEHVYVTLGSEQDIYEKLWEAVPGVEPYPYWNNTDRPSHVSEAEWEERGANWSAATSAEKGLKTSWRFYAVPESSGFASIDDMLRHIPSFESRVTDIAKAIVHASGKGPKIENAGGMHKLVEWLCSDEFKTVVEAEKPALRRRLKQAIGKDDLIGNPALERKTQ